MRRGLGLAAEWIHHPAAIAIAAGTAGPAGVAAYLIAYVAPGRLPLTLPGWLRILSPLAMIGAASFPMGITGLCLLGAIAGVGRAADRRPSAWLAGIEPMAGLPAVLGASVGAATLIGGSPRQALYVAAAALLMARSDVSSPKGPLIPALLPSAMAAAILIGLRVLEPVLLLDPSAGAVFGLAWALGLAAAVHWSNDPDARAVAAAPFVAAASIAFMGTVVGPGMLFLWMVVGASVCLVVASASTPSDRGSGSRLLDAAVVAGAVVGGGGFISELASTLWAGAAALIVGGFASLALLTRHARKAAATRISETGTVAVQELAPAPVPEPVAAPVVPPLEQAARELLDALRVARQIRRSAIEQLRDAADPRAPVRAQVLSIADRLEEVALAVERRVSSLSG